MEKKCSSTMEVMDAYRERQGPFAVKSLIMTRSRPRDRPLSRASSLAWREICSLISVIARSIVHLIWYSARRDRENLFCCSFFSDTALGHIARRREGNIDNELQFDVGVELKCVINCDAIILEYLDARFFCFSNTFFFESRPTRGFY
jgi:hypothetical protein